MFIVESEAYPQEGVGKPDYSRLIHAGRQRAGIQLEYNQSLKLFFVIFTSVASVFAWIKAPLAPGAMGHLVDAETDFDMPYTLPEGYTISLVQDSFGFKEDAEVWILYHAAPIAQLSVSAGGLELYRNRVIPFSSSILDPHALAAHPIDIQVTNQGLGNLEGSFAVAAIIEAVGTKPLPTIKTVRCKHCGHQWDVPVETTELICPECGKLTMVYNLRQFRGTP